MGHKPIPGYEAYGISECGEIVRLAGTRASRSGRVLKPKLTGFGYHIAKLCIDGELSYHFVHRLVAIAHLGPPPFPRAQVCHNDGSKLNNHVANLRWDSSYGNMADKIAHGRLQSGERNGKTTLTEEQVAAIRSTPRKHGVWAALGRTYGVAPSTIQRIHEGKSWRYTAHEDA